MTYLKRILFGLCTALVATVLCASAQLWLAHPVVLVNAAPSVPPPKAVNGTGGADDFTLTTRETLVSETVVGVSSRPALAAGLAGLALGIWVFPKLRRTRKAST